MNSSANLALLVLPHGIDRKCALRPQGLGQVSQTFPFSGNVPHLWGLTGHQVAFSYLRKRRCRRMGRAPKVVLLHVLVTVRQLRVSMRTRNLPPAPAPHASILQIALLLLLVPPSASGGSPLPSRPHTQGIPGFLNSIPNLGFRQMRHLLPCSALMVSLIRSAVFQHHACKPANASFHPYSKECSVLQTPPPSVHGSPATEPVETMRWFYLSKSRLSEQLVLWIYEQHRSHKFVTSGESARAWVLCWRQ